MVAPGSEEARQPAYWKTTPCLQGQNQEQTETIKGSDSKVNIYIYSPLSSCCQVLQGSIFWI